MHTGWSTFCTANHWPLGNCSLSLSANKLKLNPNKTELIIFWSKIHEKLNKSFPVNIPGNFLYPAEEVRNLGIWFDRDFFPFRSMSRTFVGSVLFKFRILSITEAI